MKILRNIAGVCLSILVLMCLTDQVVAQDGQGKSDKLYLNTNEPIDKRVRDLISRLTLEEKATLLNHRGPVVEPFKIKSDGWNQSLHGVWWDRPTTMFPVSIAMAATWNTTLIREVANAISDEARGIYNGWHQDTSFKGEKKGLIYRAPVINVSRNPYWGRINECYGEDPFLTGRIGVAYIKGLQGDDPKYLKLVSTLKHFAVNNVETNRKALSATVSERMLFEFWLPHFRDCIIEGGAQSVMASYNAINGVPNNINKMLLTDILKKQWGFKGFVVSDLGGVNTMVNGHEKGEMTFEDAVAQSLNAGCDFSDKEFMDYIPTAVRKGLLSEERLNDALYRVMFNRFHLGEFDPPSMVPFSKISPDVIGSAKHRQLALKTAQESMVLLTNKNHILPLDKNKIKTIAVIGPHADLFTAGGYSGRVTNPITPLQGIKNHVGPGTEILYERGCPILTTKDSTDALVRSTRDELQKAVDAARKADVVIVYVGTTLAIEAEGRDRTSLRLPSKQEELVRAVMAANPKTIVVEMNAGPLTIPEIKESAPAIIEAWWGGEEGGDAIADVIFGNINPGGKLPLTVYANEEQVPSVDEYDVTKGFTYMYINGKPLFPFGHGLSYTDFKYSNFKIASKRIDSKGQITVNVTVQNTGKVKGDEVVQLYVHDVVSSVKRPMKELRGFQRISLNPGQQQILTFSVPADKLAFYDEKTHAFVVEPGMFDLMIGSSSEDIRAKGQVEVVSN
jgi:beta-glucosidase